MIQVVHHVMIKIFTLTNLQNQLLNKSYYCQKIIFKIIINNIKMNN